MLCLTPNRRQLCVRKGRTVRGGKNEFTSRKVSAHIAKKGYGAFQVLNEFTGDNDLNAPVELIEIGIDSITFKDARVRL